MKIDTRNREDELLTGRTRLRTDWRGRVVVQVEYKEPADSPGLWYFHWRDMRVADMEFDLAPASDVV